MGSQRHSRSRAVLAVLLFTITARADGQGTLRTIRDDFKYAIGDMLYVWSSPFHADAKDWATAAAVIGGSAALMPVDDDIYRWMVEHPKAGIRRVTEPFRESSDVPLRDFGTLRQIHPVTAGVYVVGLAAGSEKIRDAAMGCAAAGEANSVPRHIIYETISRRRPYVSPNDQNVWKLGGGPWDDHSFFGGHVANAMACSTFLSDRFELGIVEPLLYATALGIGIARVEDGRHWTSDSVLGIVYGYAIGKTVASRQLARRHKQENTEKSVNFEPRHGLEGSPFLSSGSRGVVVGWKGTF
jgi:hypothetical protein